MDFVTNKIDGIKEIINQKKDSEDYGLMLAMLGILESLAEKQDMQTVKLDELEEEIEYQNSVIKDMQQVILTELGFAEEKEAESEEETQPHSHIHDHSGHGHECSCGCEDGEKEEFYTLQCPYCEELFFIEGDEIDKVVECPFCDKSVKAAENRVE